MKINIQHLKNKFVVEVENLDLTIEELKKRLEEVMNESVRIPADEQTLIFEREKLENTKKLSDYVKSNTGEIKLFVIKQQKNQIPISKPSGSSHQGTEASGAPSGGNPYANFGQPAPNPHGYGSPQPMYGQMPPYGYGSPQNMYGQMPYGYGSPQQQQMPYGGYGSPQQQMPYGYGHPPGGSPQMPYGDGQNDFSNSMMQQMEQMLNNPSLLDQVLSMQNPNMTPEQKEDQKRMLKDAVNMMKSNPALFQQAFTPERLNWAMNNMNNGNPMGNMPNPNNMGNPMGYGGFPQPQYPPMGNYNQRPPGMYGYYPPPGTSPQSQSPQVDEQVYLMQLEQLRAMGFDDEESSEALKQARGEINKALDILHEKKRNEKN